MSKTAVPAGESKISVAREVLEKMDEAGVAHSRSWIGVAWPVEGMNEVQREICQARAIISPAGRRTR